MTDLLLFWIASSLNPDLEKRLEKRLFSLAGILLRVGFVALVAALCVAVAIASPGPTVGFVIICALISVIAVFRQKYVDRRTPRTPGAASPLVNKDLELEANGHTVLFNRLMR